MSIDFSGSFLLYGLVQLAWVAGAVVWVLRRDDEMPLIVSVLLFYAFTFRLWALVQGTADAVNLTSFGFEEMDLDSALEVEGFAVLGESILLASYMFAQNRLIIFHFQPAPADLLQWLRRRTFLLALFCLPLAVIAQSAVSAKFEEGKSMGFEVSSYLSLFPFVLISVAILLVALWKFGGFRTGFEKLLAIIILGGIGVLTFQPSARFQFLGWFLAATIIAASGCTSGRKAFVLTGGVAAALTLFATAGALRNADDPDAIKQATWERFAFAEDANMLDGFVLLRQVYPNLLNYSYGGEHLEILERPIPRAWWPGKPTGGYMNKLGLITADSGFTLGISPSIFGSFYQEGGIIGVIVLSIVYGVGLGKLIRFTANIHPLAGSLIRGIACASLIPLLRGGDLPGIYAWFAMAFWPCLLFLWFKRRELLEYVAPPAALHRDAGRQATLASLRGSV